MNATIDRWTTWTLTAQAARARARVEDLENAKWKRFPRKWFRANRLRQRVSVEDAIFTELRHRYGGVVNEMFSAIVREDPHQSQREVFVGSMWAGFRQRLPVTLDAAERRGSVVLWLSGEEAAWDVGADPKTPSLQRLKPAFMLRQFVDEMPDAAQRDVLRVLRYDQTSSTPSGREALRLLEHAYLGLHHVVRQYAAALEEMTDGAIDRSRVESLNDDVELVVRQYDAWLAA